MADKLATLYHKGKGGKLYSWKVWCEGADIVTEYGTTDGKKSISRKAAKPKNVGRSNETTAEEQAAKEALSMWNKKKDGKYSETPDAAEDTVFLPMLAHDYSKQKKPVEFPVDVQPKLDGVRCLAFWQNGRVVLMSRGGKEYDVKHISEALIDCLPKNYVLDGELYVHGNKLQDTIRLVKKHRDGDDGSIRISYCVYDGFYIGKHGLPWENRRDALAIVLTDIISKTPAAYIKTVYTKQITSEEELLSELELCEKNGYEGVIVRTYAGKYTLGHRSRDLLKLKKFKDAEFEIVGHTEATGNDSGTVIWTCRTPDNKEFSVRPIGTRKERATYLRRAERYYGRVLTVKYQSLTKDGIPQFPVGLAIREQMDL